MAVCKELVVQQGKTFTLLLRWETEPIVYKAVTAIAQVAPVRLTVPAHALVDGLRAACSAMWAAADSGRDVSGVIVPEFRIS